MNKLTILIFCFVCLNTSAQNTFLLKVHFLYGSKPIKKFRETEPKWFGGLLGGHVGIEGDSGKIISFVPDGKFHWFAKKHQRHSKYVQHSEGEFYSILGGIADSVKKGVVYVPVTQNQKLLFDSLSSVYLAQPPYDYTFIGIRCGAATYEILGQLGILPDYGRTKTISQIFYPAKLRKRLFEKAFENNWQIVIEEGSLRRKWEKDQL